MGNTSATVKVVPTGAGAGAEIRGVDVSKPLDTKSFATIEAAFDKHGVIFFRGQHLTPADQCSFSARFGELAVNFNSDLYGLPGTPEIFVIGNVEENGKAVALKGVGQTWHSDMCYSAIPPRATVLYALEVPRAHGLVLGDTCFANAAAAWDALPADMRRHIDGRSAVFDFTGRQRSRPVSAETVAQYPPVEHPIVRRHPRTGRESLYVMRDDCTAVSGLPDDEAKHLVNALADHILRPEFVYRHQWQEGDLLMWDNCTVQHKALADYGPDQRRCMHRTTIGGAPPK